jgi:hypothetical protein
MLARSADPADAHDARGEIDLEVAYGRPAMARTVGTAHDSSDPREELVVHERVCRSRLCSPDDRDANRWAAQSLVDIFGPILVAG